MNILVTGGSGFIGANFIRHMLSSYSYQIINLDLLTYAGNLDNLRDVERYPNYHFIQGDIGDGELVTKILETYEIQVIINFAAESHVDRSIDDPFIFLKTNVIGTTTLLEAAKKYWKVNPFNERCLMFKEKVKFIQISTDEVYGELGKEGLFLEENNLIPNSPYSASKASADLMVRAYQETYGLPTMITRCSNNYGPHQNKEKFIPLIIDRLLNDQPVPVYGEGKQIRDWLHVLDHCKAIDVVLHKGEMGEVYNIGGNYEKENIEIVQLIIKHLNKSEALIEYVDDRLGHDFRYGIDNTKITTELNWSPSYSFDEGILMTIEWYLLNHKKDNLK